MTARASAYVADDASDQGSLSTTATFPNCRLGAAVGGTYFGAPDFAKFNLGTYLNFSANISSEAPSTMAYWAMVHTYQDKDSNGSYLPTYTFSPSANTFAQVAANNPGLLWIIGNEPDRAVAQDDIHPDIYARAYHEAYQIIKTADPTARIAVAGLVGFTPGRAQYLDIVWDTYQALYGEPMPVDAWTIHPYVLWESGGAGAWVALGTDPNLAIPRGFDCADPNSICLAEHDDIDLFAEQVVRMRQWMRRHGQQNKPLLVTEWGILLPEFIDGEPYLDENGETFHPARVAEYMRKTQEYFLNATDPQIGYPADNDRLVQQWAWFPFSVDWIEASAGNLVQPTAPYASTTVGLAWQEYVANMTPEVNLMVQASSSAVRSGAAGAEISATLFNNGNTGTSGPVTVTFYKNAARTQQIGSTVSLPAQPGCLWGETITVDWAETLAPGAHPFWVEVTSSNSEVRTDDNVAQGWVLVASDQILLPVVVTQY